MGKTMGNSLEKTIGSSLEKTCCRSAGRVQHFLSAEDFSSVLLSLRHLCLLLLP